MDTWRGEIIALNYVILIICNIRFFYKLRVICHEDQQSSRTIGFDKTGKFFGHFDLIVGIVFDDH